MFFFLNVISCIISLNIIRYIIRPLRTMVRLCMLQYTSGEYCCCASISNKLENFIFLILATEFRNLNSRAIYFPNDSLSFSSWTFLARATAVVVVVVVVAQVRSSILYRVRRHGASRVSVGRHIFCDSFNNFQKCRSIDSFLKKEIARQSYQLKLSTHKNLLFISFYSQIILDIKGKK